MPNKCAVLDCKNRTADKTLTFYKFPDRDKSPVRFFIWTERTHRKNFIPSRGDVICSIHFSADDLDETCSVKTLRYCEKTTVQKPTLKKSAVPTLHLKRVEDVIDVDSVEPLARRTRSRTALASEPVFLPSTIELETNTNSKPKRPKIQEVDVRKNDYVEMYCEEESVLPSMQVKQEQLEMIDPAMFVEVPIATRRSSMVPAKVPLSVVPPPVLVKMQSPSPPPLIYPIKSYVNTPIMDEMQAPLPIKIETTISTIKYSHMNGFDIKDDDSEWDLFGQLIATQIKDLKNKTLRMEVRKRIVSVLFDAREKDDV